jgi:hypothetical protein
MTSAIQATTTETTKSTQSTALDKKKNTDTTNTSPAAPVPSLISKKNTKTTKTKYSTSSNVRKPSKENELLRAKHAMQNLGLAPKWKITEATNKTEEKTTEEILIKRTENTETKNEETDEDAAEDARILQIFANEDSFSEASDFSDTSSILSFDLNPLDLMTDASDSYYTNDSDSDFLDTYNTVYINEVKLIGAMSATLYVPIHIGEFLFHALVDSGAQATLITHDVFEQISKVMDLPIHHSSIQLLDHNQRDIMQTTEPRLVPFKIGNLEVTHPTYVINNGMRNSVLLGLDFLKHAKMNIITYGKEPTITIGDPADPTEIIPTSTVAPIAHLISVNLVAKNDITLKPQESAIIPCESTKPLQDGIIEVSSTLPAHVEKNFNFRNNDGTVSVLVANTSDQDLDIHEGTELAEALIADPYDFTSIITDKDVEKATELCLFPENKGVKNLRQHLLDDPTFPKELVDDLCKYVNEEVPNVISKEEFDIGNLDLPEKYYYDYYPPDDKLPTCKPYLFNGIREDQIEKILTKYVEHGLVEHAVSPAASPGFVIARKTRNEGEDKLRFLVDYRALNAVLPMPKYPLPYWHNIIHKLQDKNWFTHIDISSAFTAVHMTERAGKAAAIITSRGQYVPKRMMQGLSTSAQHFAFVMSKVMEPVKDVASHFQDDVMVVTKGTKLDHLNDIKRVLKALETAGLKINFKANYFQKEVKYLGRIVNGQGHRPLPKHIKALKCMKKPTTKKELMAILGVTAWLSAYVPYYSTKIKSLTSALSTSPFTFSEEHEEALDNIKNEISENTALYFPDPSAPIYLAADSTARGFGAILYQVTSYSADDLKGHEIPHEWPEASVETLHPVLPPPNKKVLLPEVNLQDVDQPKKPKKKKKKPEAKTDTDTSIDKTINAINTRHDLTLTEVAGNESNKIHLVKAVAFASGAYSGAAISYSSIEKEFLCILLSLEQLKTFLYSADTTYVLTDCAPILWCLKYRYSRITKLEKYAIKLLSLPFKIIVHHLRGSIHPGDLMSRTIKVEEPTTTLTEAKRAIVINTPFHPCTLTSLENLVKYIKENPDCVQVPPPTPEPAIVTSVCSVEQDLTTARVNRITYASLEDLLGKRLTPESIASAQRKDEDCQHAITALKEGLPQPTFQLRQGLLVKEISNAEGNVHLVPVLTFELAVYAIALFHMHNHCGYHALWQLIREEYFYKGMKKLIQRFTRACDLCIQHSAKNSPKEALGMNPLPLKKADSWMIDLVTGLPKTRGKDGFLSIVCEFSNFRIAVPITSTITATGIIDLIRSHVLAIFGIMTHLRSDRGSNLLISKQMTQFCDFYGIKRHLSVPNHPQGHGRVEVSNRYIQSLVLKLSDQYDISWLDVLALAVHELNCKPRGIMRGLSPHIIMFGNQPAQVKRHPKIDEAALNPDELVRIHTDITKAAKLMIKEVEEIMMKNNQEKGGRRTFYSPGVAVYLKNFRILPKRKTQSKFHSAPHIVLHDYGPTVLCKSILGTVSLQAKENVRLAPAREAELFGRLPLEIQMVVGPPFSHEEISKAVEEGKIPEFWTAEKNRLEEELLGPQTRAQERTEASADMEEEAETRKSLETPPNVLEHPPTTFTSDGSTMDHLPQIKKVTFNI